MTAPTLQQILDIYAQANGGRYWFRTEEGEILSCVVRDEPTLSGQTVERTVSHDFVMSGLQIKWVREVVLRIPRPTHIEIRGEARVKYEGLWDFTPDLIQARLGIVEPS